ncbi:hypothetical protein [Herbaspirillum sp. alder98]|uniref:hypothetical protein n=1 Tax=Herbaspirillum sp. alder98 TaxID=2913096 RepID=UPI001CD83081|nr:hypothetical protein [Herbaspirillum sp. alder98]MCA1326589.1 hypothetical protein [Herbaspirillum sp. alder98]
MDQSDSLIPNFAQVFGAAIGSVTQQAVMPARPAAGPIDREIRRINSAHQPEVREVASDNEIGREIVEDDARKLAAQKRSVRKNAQRVALAPGKPRGDEPG